MRINHVIKPTNGVPLRRSAPFRILSCPKSFSTPLRVDYTRRHVE